MAPEEFCPSRTAYTSYWCRCEGCREANAAYLRRYRARRPEYRHVENARRRARRRARG